ncbi:hypothetical protein SEA_REINDEER_131 [Mycobacterium phage Reindeer]|uniref:Uncharacterized protein n=1 Tax=Mycobacterium phage Reindeer TaxID=2762283 RepID=A0A7G8LI50_9CAUD|nr:RF-1 domain peptide chain release factor [Mycobacterium phage Reindeer]QNJ56922.1 hypothetical protein SEA_REINDEER_131 [Mycobacterium phage Reindeer]
MRVSRRELAFSVTLDDCRVDTFRAVERDMWPVNLKTEVRENGKWVVDGGH